MSENFPEQNIDQFRAACGDFLSSPSGTMPELETMLLLFAEALQFGDRKFSFPVHDDRELRSHLAMHAVVLFSEKIVSAHGFRFPAWVMTISTRRFSCC